MKEIVIATRNLDKKTELSRLLKGLKIKVLSLGRFPCSPTVKEGSRSFRENAVRKAMAISKFTKRVALADDSGLETLALAGRPGVRSSRFAGTAATYADNNRKLLKLLEGKRRIAVFRCVVAVCDYPKLVGVVEAKAPGTIAFQPKGKYGFGYDPVFIASGYHKTFAQLAPRVKDKISHRARALKKAKRLLIRYFKLDAPEAQ